MCMYVCICAYMQAISVGIAGIGPLGHGNHHHVLKTLSCDPAPGGTHSCREPQGICTSTLFLHPCHSTTPDFVHPPRAACVLGPFGLSLGPLESDQCPLRQRRSCLKPCHSLSGVVAPLHPAGLGRSSPSKAPPYRDWLVCGQRSPPLPQSTFLGPGTRWAPLRASQGMCPPLYSVLPVPLQDPILRAACVHAASLCVGICRYMHVCAAMCNYPHISVGMCRYVSVCARP